MLKTKVEIKVYITDSDGIHNKPVVVTSYFSDDSKGNPRFFNCPTSALMVALGRAFRNNIFSDTKLLGEILIFDRDKFRNWIKDKENDIGD